MKYMKYMKYKFNIWDEKKADEEIINTDNNNNHNGNGDKE